MSLTFLYISDLSGLYVTNQNLTGFENDRVTVNCHHHVKHNVEWCKFGGHCMSRTSETKDGAFVEIRYSRAVMTVTMNKLKMENTGWYSCSSKDLQMPVFITVQQKMSPTPTKARKRYFSFDQMWLTL